ncbi:MAG: hypothetical protein HRU12_01245 [Phaeodactylibacter sp.]|nr:hypothetical protein [Phaeodactylibacter sp.]
MKMILLLLSCLALSSLYGQHAYSVSTLIPENARVLNDGLAIDEEGTVYGSYWGIWQGAVGRHVLRYRTNGTYDTLATGLTRPNGLSYKDGNVLVANAGSGGQLILIDTTGAKTVFANVPGISHAVPVPGTDSLIATSWGGNKIYGISAQGVVTTVNTSPLYNGPVGAAFGHDGALYVGNFTDGKIIKVQDGDATLFADLGGGIGFLTYADSAIWATNHTDKRVYKIPLTGSMTPEVIAGSGNAVIEDGFGQNASFRSPNGIVCTPSGDTIYVSEFAGNALRMIIRIPTVVNTADETWEIQPKLFPNPTSEVLQIKDLPANFSGRAIIQDSTGKSLQTISAEALNSPISIASLPKGWYTLKLLDQTENKSTDLPFVIQ